MLKILLAATDRQRLAGLKTALEEHDDIRLFHAGSGDEALVTAKADKNIDLAVADEQLGDMSGLEYAERLLAVSAMISTAVVSPLDADEFHEVSEGLGVLMQLPPLPGKREADQLLARLREIVRLTRPGN